MTIAEVLRSAGASIRDSWCGPCFGQGPDALKPGERAITSFNRNWQNRMGLGGEGFLASPAVVAASALLGYMAPPGELGLDFCALFVLAFDLDLPARQLGGQPHVLALFSNSE